MTIRVKLYEDEWGSLHIDTSVEDAELEKYGVDVPDELVATAKRMSVEWNAHQAELKSWWESTLPADDAEAERVMDVAFYEGRTWAELAAFVGCEHVDAIKALKANMGYRITRCGTCGESIFASKLTKNNDE